MLRSIFISLIVFCFLNYIKGQTTWNPDVNCPKTPPNLLYNSDFTTYSGCEADGSASRGSSCICGWNTFYSPQIVDGWVTMWGSNSGGEGIYSQIDINSGFYYLNLNYIVFNTNCKLNVYLTNLDLSSSQDYMAPPQGMNSTNSLLISGETLNITNSGNYNNVFSVDKYYKYILILPQSNTDQDVTWIRINDITVKPENSNSVYASWGGSKIVCPNQTTDLNITCQGGTAPYTVTYSWNNGTSTIPYTVTVPNGNPYVLLNKGAGIYSIVSVTDNLGTNGLAIGQNATISTQPLPGSSSNISGPQTIIGGQTDNYYYIPEIQNATSYVWSYSGTGETINGNQSSVTINFGLNATSGNLTVKGINDCGEGVSSENFYILVNSPTSIASNQECFKRSTCTGRLMNKYLKLFTPADFNSYNWYRDVNGNQSIDPSVDILIDTKAYIFITEPGFYMVQVADASGTKVFTKDMTRVVDVNTTEAPNLICNGNFEHSAEKSLLGDYLGQDSWSGAPMTEDQSLSWFGFVSDNNYVYSVDEYNTKGITIDSKVAFYDEITYNWVNFDPGNHHNVLYVSGSAEYYSPFSDYDWMQQVSVTPNTNYEFSFYVTKVTDRVLLSENYNCVGNPDILNIDFGWLNGSGVFESVIPNGVTVSENGAAPYNFQSPNGFVISNKYANDGSTQLWYKITYRFNSGDRSSISFQIRRINKVLHCFKSLTLYALDDISLVAQSEAPSATISGSTTLCQGQTADLTINCKGGVAPYVVHYDYNNGTTTETRTANIPNANLFVLKVQEAGTYTLKDISDQTAADPVIEGQSATVTLSPVPSAAGTITGISSVSPGQNNVSFSISPIANASTYSWNYSGTGVTIKDNSSTVTIDFTANATSGNLTVSGVNSCGTGTVSAPFPVNVIILPDPAGPISGSATVCQGQSSVAYSVPQINNATSYQWSYSGTGVNINGNSNPVTIDFLANATLGTLTVKGINDNGAGTVSSNYAVTVNPLPVFAGNGTWTQKTNYPFEINKYLGMACSNGIKGYAGLGSYLKGFWEFNPSSGEWTQKADLGGDQRRSAASFAIGNKIYVCLGYNYSAGGYLRDTWEYDITTDTWMKKADFPAEGRGAFINLTIGNKGYIGTGYGASGKMFNDFWEYDPATDTWTQKANFPGDPVYSCAGFTIGNTGYVLKSYTKELWAFDPISNTWTRKGDFGGIERSFSVGFAVGSKGYIGLGESNNFMSDLWEYNPILDSWSQKTGFYESRLNELSFSIGDKAYILSGSDSNESFKNDFWEFSLGSGTPVITSENGSTVHTGQTGVTYHVNEIANADRYIWSYSGTGVKINGESSTVTIDFTENATSGNLTVYGVNSCGNSVASAPFPVNVVILPDPAGPISGTATVCQGQSSVSYSVPQINNATSYLWSYSGTGVNINGNSNPVTIDFLANATSGNLTVRGVNANGSGISSSDFAIVINKLPVAESNGIWIQKENLPFPSNRSFGISCSSGLKGYLGLGIQSNYVKDFWEFDPVTGSWNQKAEFPGLGRENAISFAVDNKIYVGLGFNDYSGYLKDLWEYDVQSNTWTKKADFPSDGRWDFICLKLGNKAYIGGGVADIVYKDFWEYNPSTDTWTKKNDLPNFSDSDYGFSVDNKGFIIISNHYVYEYNDQTDTWQQKTDLTDPKRYFNFFNVGDKAYLFSPNSLIEYNYKSDQWTPKNNFVENRVLPRTFSIGNSGYIMSGKDSWNGNIVNDFWEYKIGQIIITSENGSIVNKGQTGVAYHVNEIANAERYVWNYSGTGVKINGEGSTVTIDYTADATSGNLTVYGENSCGISSKSENYAVTVQTSKPLATITGSASICAGQNVGLTITCSQGIAPYTVNYEYNSGNTTNINTLTVADSNPYVLSVQAPGTYTIKSVTDHVNTTTIIENQSATVVVFPPVLLNVTPLNPSICIGEKITLEGNKAPGGTFTGIGMTDNGNGTASFEAVAPGNYDMTYMFTDNNGCSASLLNKIVVRQLPEVSFTGLNETYQFGTTPTALAGSPSGGRFSGYDGLSQQSDDSYQFNPNKLGEYVVEYTYSDGYCSNSTTKNVVVYNKPQAWITGSGIMCGGQPTEIIIKFAGKAPYSFRYADGTSESEILTTSENSYSFMASEAGKVYTLTYFKDSYTEGTGTGKVTIVNQVSPSASIAGTASICTGDKGSLSVTFDKSGAKAFSYAINGITQPEIATDLAQYNLEVSNTGTYTLLNVTQGGCSGAVSGSGEVVVYPIPDVRITGLAERYCKDGPEVSVTGYPAGGTFTSNIPGFTVKNGLGTFLPTAAGNNYSVVYTYSNGHCSKAFTDNTSIISSPSASIKNAGFICGSRSAEITLNLSGSGAYTVGWTENGQSKSGTLSNTENSIYASQPGTVALVSISSYNCPGTASGEVTITAHKEPSITIDGAADMCIGTGSTIPVKLSGIGPWEYTVVKSPSSITYNSLDSISSFPVNEAGTYYINSLKDAYCSVLVNKSIVVKQKNNPVAELTGLGGICDGEPANLKVNLSGVTNQPYTFVYSINGINQQPVVTDQAEYSITADQPSTYSMVSVEAGGCNGVAIGTIDVEVHSRPQATISGGGEILIGQAIPIQFDLEGTPDWKVSYKVDEEESQLAEFTTAKSSMDVYNPGIYKFTKVSDKFCEKDLDAEVTITAPGEKVECKECIQSFAPVPGQRYVLSAWVKLSQLNDKGDYSDAGISLFFEGANSTVGPLIPKGPIIDGWQRIEEEFVVPNAASAIEIKLVNSSKTVDAFFDDIRIFPFKGNMKSYVYDPVTLKLKAVLDENNYATFYEYDEEGRLIRVKKETERGVKTIQESYNNVKIK